MNVQDVPRGDTSRDAPHDGDYASVALIGEAGALLAQRRRDIPDDFLAKLFGLAVPQDLERYTAAELAGIAERSWSLLQERPAGAAKISFEPLPGKTGGAVLEIINDDMPFLVDSVLGEINQRGLDIRLFVHPVFIVERDAAGRLVNFKGARNVGGAARELHSHPPRRRRRRGAARRSRPRGRGHSRRRPRRVQDWKPMLSRISGIIADLRSNPPPLPVDEIAEAIQFLEWIADDNFTLLGARDYSFTASGDALEPSFETGLGLLRSHGVRLLQRWNQPLTITPEIRAFLEQPKAAHRHQGDDPLARASARLSRLYRHQALRPFAASSSASADSAACSPRPPIRVRRAAFRICGARSTASSAAPASIRRVIPARRWSMCSRPIRATSCSRSTRTCSISSRWRSCSSTSVRARACCRGATVSTVSSRCSSMCRATATTARCGRRSAIIWPRPSMAMSAPIIRSSPKARWCGCISSSAAIAARRSIRIARHSTAMSRRSCAAGPTICARRCRPAPIRHARAPCSRAIATLSRSTIARSIRRRSRSPISASSRR